MHVKHKRPGIAAAPTALYRADAAPTPSEPEGHTWWDGRMRVERLTAASLLFVNAAPPLKYIICHVNMKINICFVIQHVATHET